MAVSAYSRWVQESGGYNIDAEPPQALVCLPDPRLALESLHALMHEGERYGFTVAAGLVQAIRSSEHVPRTQSDFTERTLATVIELSGSVGPQSVGVSTKLSSLLRLAVPEYAAFFESAENGSQREVTRVQQLLVMRASRLPPYQGALRIYAGH